MDSSWTADTIIRRIRDFLRESPTGSAQLRPGRRGLEEVDLTRAELWREAARVARGLHEMGAKPGDAVLILAENSPRWLHADFALLGLGCPGVPRGVDSPPEEVEFIISKVSARFAFVESPRHVDRVRDHLGTVERIVLLDGSADDVDESIRSRVVSFEELRARAGDDPQEEWFDERIAERSPEEIATIVFTSGTTGQPKGVVLQQANLAANLNQVLGVIDFLHGCETYVAILPPWHMFERLVEYALLGLGLRIVYTDRRHFAIDLKKYRPDVLIAVPRLWVLLMDGVLGKLAEAPPFKKRLVHTALRIGSAWTRTKRVWRGRLPNFPGSPPPPSKWSVLPHLALAPLYGLARLIVLDKIAAAIGIDRLRTGTGVSGGGALPEHVDLFLEGLGIRILNGYGLTETSPVLAVRIPGRNIVGTVGPPVPQTEIEIRDLETGKPIEHGQQGVIHARGPQIMRGYFEEEAATKKVMDARGWFDTGDLGRLTAQGELAITGRAKDTIVLLSGENIEPEPLENALTESPLIEQAVVVGQDQKFLGALIVPNREHAEVETLNQHELDQALQKEIQNHVSPRRGFRAHERIVRFHVLEEPFSREDGSMSQTLKLKRNVIHDRHAPEIDGLFDKNA